MANLWLRGDACTPKARLGFEGFLLLSSTNSGQHSRAWAQCAAYCWFHVELPSSPCAFRGMRCCAWPVECAPGAGCLQAKCPEGTACLRPFVWAGLSCSSVYEKRNTGTDKDIGRECGPVLLALTLELVGN